MHRWSLEVTALWFVIAFLACSILPLKANPLYCVIEVRVVKPSGSPFSEVPVALARHEGGSLRAITESKTDRNGEVKFCDAPIDDANIVVGFDMCGSVVVRDLETPWPDSHKIVVTYDGGYCYPMIFSKRCVVLLRVKDNRGGLVPGALFDGLPFGTTRSDAFGRIYISVAKGEKIDGVVSKVGVGRAQVHQLCLEQNGDQEEKSVVLRK